VETPRGDTARWIGGGENTTTELALGCFTYRGGMAPVYIRLNASMIKQKKKQCPPNNYLLVPARPGGGSGESQAAKVWQSPHFSPMHKPRLRG